MQKKAFIFLFFALFPLVSPAQKSDFKPVKIEAQRLPDLNIPRAHHTTFYAGGELIVAGGHTTGFIPTPTAAYFRDGAWHTLPMTYPHDGGAAVVMRSGKVLLAGGFKENLGIGQTFEAEVYDPQTHTFGGYGCMDQRRTFFSATELDSGRVLIGGNWYQKDWLEVYDGQKFSFVKNLSAGRAAPYILPTRGGDALIFGSWGTRGEALRDSTAIVDRLKGAPFVAPLLREWWPDCTANFPHPTTDGFIGDAAQGDFTYLLVARNREGEARIVMVRDTVFSLLPDCPPLPATTAKGDTINWYSAVLADRARHCAYVVGFDREKRAYIAQLQGAIYYTSPLPDCEFSMPILTPDGDLLIAGGAMTSTNYKPSAAVWLIPLGTESEAAASNPLTRTGFYIIAVIISLVVLLFALYIIIYSRNKRVKVSSNPAIEEELRSDESSAELEASPVGGRLEGAVGASLFPRLIALIESEQLFRKPDLKITDVATALGSNNRYVSESIRAASGKTFTQFITDYRLAYAQQLLRQHPEKKIVEVYTEAGFSSERSFFRLFKAATGMTTQEWMQKNAEPLDNSAEK